MGRLDSEPTIAAKAMNKSHIENRQTRPNILCHKVGPTTLNFLKYLTLKKTSMWLYIHVLKKKW